MKDESVDVTILRAITQQKQLSQSVRITRNASNIFNTLRAFIRNQPKNKKSYFL